MERAQRYLDDEERIAADFAAAMACHSAPPSRGVNFTLVEELRKKSEKKAGSKKRPNKAKTKDETQARKVA